MNAATKGTPLSIRALLLVILVTFAWSVSVAITQTRLKAWPKTQAEILEFTSGENPATGMQNWYANPKIRFAYNVDGETFESRRLNPSPLNYQAYGQLKADTDGFRVGSPIRCWYNPKTPSVAYAVNRGVTIDILIVAGLTGVLILNAIRVFISRTTFPQKKNAG